VFVARREFDRVKHTEVCRRHTLLSRWSRQRHFTDPRT